MLRSTLECYYGGACSASDGTMTRPLIHQPTTLREQVAATVRTLNLVAHTRSEGHLGDFARVAGPLSGPISERRSETVRSQIVATHPFQQFQHRHIRQRLAALAAGKHKVVAVNVSKLGLLDDCYCGSRQRHP